MEREARREDEGSAEEAARGLADGSSGAGASVDGTGFDVARAWRLAAYALLAGAAALLFLRRPEAAFFTAALGVAAWFLNVRVVLKHKHDLVRDGARNWRPRRDVRDPDPED